METNSKSTTIDTPTSNSKNSVDDSISSMTETSSSIIDPKNYMNDDQGDTIFNPRVRIRTGTREFLVGYKSCVRIVTKSGVKIGSAVKDVEKDYLVLSKSNTKVFYKDIEKIRMYPTRRWFPIITSYAIVPPIFWFAISRVASHSSSDCRRQIKDIRVINKYSVYGYGRDKCN